MLGQQPLWLGDPSMPVYVLGFSCTGLVGILTVHGWSCDAGRAGALVLYQGPRRLHRRPPPAGSSGAAARPPPEPACCSCCPLAAAAAGWSLLQLLASDAAAWQACRC
jgi:hypothetical protein